MVCGFELGDMDWSNQDVHMELFSKKFGVLNREIAQKNDTMVWLPYRIEQLEDAMQMKPYVCGGKKPQVVTHINTGTARMPADNHTLWFMWSAVQEEPTDTGIMYTDALQS